MALATDMVVGSAPVERAGAAAAISSTAPQIGGAFGVAVLGSVITAVYRHAMAAGVPAGVPDGVAHAARDNLGTAAAVVRQLPSPVAEPLLTAARAAFTSGFQMTSLVSAVLMVLVAVLVLRLRPGRLTPQATARRPSRRSRPSARGGA